MQTSTPETCAEASAHQAAAAATAHDRRKAIWLASYPRSGNTWSRLALLSLRQAGAPIDLADVKGFGRMTASRDLIDDWLCIDSTEFNAREQRELRPDLHDAYFAAAREPMLCKVHDAWGHTDSGRELFARELTHATLYLIRDPRDVAVSWAHFRNSTIDESIDFLNNPRACLCPFKDRPHLQIFQHLGDWSEHALSWIDASGLAPLVVRYEDLLSSTPVSLQAMARHIGWPADAETLQRATQATSFGRLADIEAQQGFFEKPITAARFFRTGRAGDWRNTLNAAQALRIERAHRSVMMRFGYL